MNFSGIFFICPKLLSPKMSTGDVSFEARVARNMNVLNDKMDLMTEKLKETTTNDIDLHLFAQQMSGLKDEATRISL